MIFSEKNDSDLYTHCLSVIERMPRYQEGLANSIAASAYFGPLHAANNRKELRDHLQMIEDGLLDEQSCFSKVGEKVISLYARSEFNQMSLGNVVIIGNYIRLLLIGLACDKVLKLNSAFKIAIQSQKQFETVKSYKNIYPHSVFEALAIGTTDRVLKHKNELPKELLDALGEASIAYKSRSGASLALARACLCFGVETLSQFKYTYWEEFFTGYRSVSDRPDISMASLVRVLGKYNNDQEIVNKFFSERHQKDTTVKNSDICVLLGSRSEAKSLLGEISYLKNGVRYDSSVSIEYFRSFNTKVVSYGYWNSSEVNRSEFSPKSLNTEISKVWMLAQDDYHQTKTEYATKKSVESRLSVLNIYLFSYLPAYFSHCQVEAIKFPRLPRDFISAIYVQRSPIFEYEAKLPADFQFPVLLEDFVHSFEESKAKIGTQNENTAKGVMREISLFFDHLVSLGSTDKDSDFYIKTNPVRLAYSKIKGTKYIKSRKEVMSLTYWSGFRIFVKILSNKLLDDNLAIIGSGKTTTKKLTNYPINSKFNFFGTEITIGEVDLTDLGVYWHRINSEKTVRLPNVNLITILSFISYSGQRLSNTFWLDVNSYRTLESKAQTNKDSLDYDLVEVLINTDKALTKEFPIFIPRFIFNMLGKVEKILSLNKYDWSRTELDYQGEDGSKWGKITPLFRTAESHTYPTIPMAALLAQYENCLTASGIKIKDSQIFYMPAKHVSTTEHIHIISSDKKHINEITAKVKYFDEQPVQFTPIKLGSLITPHSLRVMISSVYSPALGEDVVSELMTGQTEATVGYYTVDLDSTSSDLIAHMSSLMNLGGKKIVSESRIDQEDFKRRLRDGTATFDYQASSMNLSPDMVFDDESLPSSGLAALHSGSGSALAFNRTHICPFNNDCPRSIITEIGEHECSMCPFTITTTNHIPAIAAEVRSKSDLLKNIKLKLDIETLSEVNRSKLEKDRNRLLREVTNWYVRLKVISNNPNGLFVMSPEGKTRLFHDTPITSDVSPLQAFLRRLDEVKGAELLQTESLKIQSARFMRLAEINIDKVDWDSVPEFNEVDAAYNYFLTLCEVSSLDVKTTLESIEHKFANQKLIAKAIGV